MRGLQKRVKSFLKAEDGPSAVEYAILLAIILTGAIGVLTTFGDGVNGLYLAIAGAAG